jgi:hypothetical protein
LSDNLSSRKPFSISPEIERRNLEDLGVPDSAPEDLEALLPFNWIKTPPAANRLIEVPAA